MRGHNAKRRPIFVKLPQSLVSLILSLLVDGNQPVSAPAITSGLQRCQIPTGVGGQKQVRSVRLAADKGTHLAGSVTRQIDKAQ
jgi:hypothetical protein